MDKKTTWLVCALLFSLILCRPENQQKESQAGKEQASSLRSFSGAIVFQSNADGDNDIYLLTSHGLTQLTHNTWSDEYPAWSPDGRSIAFAANPKGNYDLFTMSANGSGITAVTSSSVDESEPAWFSDGLSLVYTREMRTTLRREVSLYRVSLKTGKTVKVIPEYSRLNAIPHVSPQGNLVVFTGKRPIGWDVAMYNIGLKTVEFLDQGGKSCRARFSGNGKQLAYVSSQADGKGDIWLMLADGSQKMRLTERFDTYDYFPAWAPDGEHIVFSSSNQHSHEGDWALHIAEVRTGKAELLYDGPGSDIFPDWH
jgi:Tol biopolymer transport system component